MSLSGAQRGEIIYKMANLLEEQVDSILEANQRDLAKANSSGKFSLFFEKFFPVFIFFKSHISTSQRKLRIS